MQNERPRISLSWEPMDLVTEIINITLLILMWSYILMNYSDLPDIIPTHFNAAGEADDHGSKVIIWILPGIATLTYALLFVLNRFPHLHNYLVNITEENAEKNYRLSTRVMRFINLFCLLIFAALIYEIINLAKGNDSIFSSYWFIAITLIVPLIIVVIAFRMGKMINK